jgi:hypothetical protein
VNFFSGIGVAGDWTIVANKKIKEEAIGIILGRELKILT